MLRTILAFLVASTGFIASAAVEVGEINGAKFRIDMPDTWNGSLIVYCHGYSPIPGRYDEKPATLFAPAITEGYAVIQSGYSAGGWAVEQAVQDTEALRRYFLGKYGKPKQTFVMGHSMGGFLTMTMLEKFPNAYDGGLALCGPLAPAEWFMERRVFEMRVVFDYYFPGALPDPAKVPADYAMSPALNRAIETLLDGKPEQAGAMQRWSGIPTNKDLAGTLVFFTFILKDLQQRGGGNPFDNRDTVYSGTPDDNALNDGVARYQADASAAEYLRTFYTPTGRMVRPMLAIHTTYDPLVPPWTPNAYADLARAAGHGDMFVQQYVRRGGHCAFNAEEVWRGFKALREWKETGKRPAQPAK